VSDARQPGFRKKGDDRPIRARLERDGKIVPLTDDDGDLFTAIWFRMAPAENSLGPTVVAAADADPERGFVTYQPAPEDVATAGVFRVEISVTWIDSDLGTETFPGDGYASLVIVETLA